MRQLMRGERVKLSELAAINHLWEIEVSIDAPVYIVDFCCLGLDENGEVFDDNFVIHLNRPDAPGGAIQLNNASNNGAVFSLALDQLPPRVRRLVFTAAVGQNPLPGGLVGAAFSLLGVKADIGLGHLIMATPVAELAFFEFSGQDFADQSTIVIGEFYLRDEWRFVAAGQPLQGELSAFLRTLTDGPTPAPLVPPTPQRSAPPISAPRRPPAPPSPPPIRTAPRPATPIAPSPRPSAPSQPFSPPPPPSSRPRQPIAAAPATIVIPSAPLAAPAPVPAPAAIAPVAPLNLPQSVPPGGKLQDLIDAAAPGSTLILQRGEYQGPLTINKPLALEARDSAIWSREGPVVTLASPGVSLHDLDLEITVSSADAGEKGVALRVNNPQGPLELESVQLRGRLAGLGDSDGSWQLPRALNLREFAARAENVFHFQIEVPTSVTLSCSVGGVGITPAQVQAGTHQITLRASDIAPDTLLVGQIEVRSSSVLFSISLRGSAQQGVEAARGTLIGDR